MKRSTGPILLTCLTVAAVFAGCSDDPPPANNPVGGSGGSSTAGTTATMAGTTSAGTAGSFSTAGTETGGTAGSGGAGGTAGATGGGGTMAGTAGTGGTPEPIVPTIVLIDNVRLQLKAGFVEGGGGAGGSDGAGGAGDIGVGGMPDVGVGGEPAVGGAGGEGGGDTGPVDDPPWPVNEPGLNGFFHEFTANVMPFAFNGNGFSPGPGMSEGPPIQNATTMVHVANMGRPGGAVQLSVPFTVKRQQADISGTFPTMVDLTHYELVAEVKLVSAAYGAECTSAWMYVYGGNGYANDASGEPAQYTTGHLEQGAWKTVRLDLDGPYGFHSSPTFIPELVQLWGLQLNTWGCP